MPMVSCAALEGVPDEVYIANLLDNDGSKRSIHLSNDLSYVFWRMPAGLCNHEYEVYLDTQKPAICKVLATTP